MKHTFQPIAIMKPRIEELQQKYLVGMHLTTNFINNRVAELWKRFMPRLSEIQYRSSVDLISMSVYSESHFSEFNPANDFEKWAAAEVNSLQNMPDGMEGFVLQGGLYAVFEYRGSSSDSSVFRYIYGEWLPGSGYELDVRPHFEVLGPKYRNNDPSSEEEIWIPVKRKKY